MQAQGSLRVSPQGCHTLSPLGERSGLRVSSAGRHVSRGRNDRDRARSFAGVAQLVEHLFCKQVVRGSSPLASSAVAQIFDPATHQDTQQEATTEPVRKPVRGQGATRTGAERTSVREHRTAGVTQPSDRIARRGHQTPGCFCHLHGGLPEWPKGAGCKPAGIAYVGSNPTPSTTLSSALLGHRPAGSDAEASSVRAGVAQLVERQPSKLNVVGSSPISRSGGRQLSAVSHQLPEVATGAPWQDASEHRPSAVTAHIAQLAERVLGKDEVTSSTLVVGSNKLSTSIGI
jgi:hypothetical protein